MYGYRLLTLVYMFSVGVLVVTCSWCCGYMLWCTGIRYYAGSYLMITLFRCCDGVACVLLIIFVVFYVASLSYRLDWWLFDYYFIIVIC